MKLIKKPVLFPQDPSHLQRTLHLACAILASMLQAPRWASPHKMAMRLLTHHSRSKAQPWAESPPTTVKALKLVTSLGADVTRICFLVFAVESVVMGKTTSICRAPE